MRAHTVSASRDEAPAPRFLARVLASDRLWAFSLPPVVCLTFLAGVRNGLVGDDWGLIKWCRFHGIGSVLDAFNPLHDAWWYYRPLLKMLFGVTHALFGVAPIPYHLLSLAAHTAAVVLLYRVTRRAGADPLQSFLSALLFGVHFRHHVGLFWFSGISYPLSTSLGLASMLLFRSYLERRRARSLAGVALALAAALLSKDTSVAFVALVPLYGFLFANPPDRRPDLRKDWPCLIPIVAVLAGTVALQAMPGAVSGGPLLARGGASFQRKGVAEALSWARDAVVIWTPGLDALPVALQGRFAAALGGLLAGFVLLRRTRIVLFGAAWVVVANVPFFFFVPRTGDLYQYLPLIGVSLIAADAARIALRRPGEGTFPAGLRAPAAVLLLAACLVYSVARIQVMAARWGAAGEAISGVLNAVADTDPALASGAAPSLAIQGLPEQVNEIYTFQNAVPAAFEIVFGIESLQVTGLVPGVKGFLWEDWLFYRVDTEGRRTLLRSFTNLRRKPAGEVP